MPVDSVSRVCNAFTVDVEDYFQVSAFEACVPKNNWGQYASRVVANTERVLRILDSRCVRGTFFILGWTADRHPELVRAIHRAGHEIGCHSYWHQLIYQQTPDEFRSDLRQATEAIENIIGEKVRAYRAPSFSITQKSLWAFDILTEFGYELDSSIYPVHHDRYGIPGHNPLPHRLERVGILEFPPTVWRRGWWNLPVAGGGYFRLYPLALTSAAIRSTNTAGHPFMFYIHPWELDPDQPRIPIRSLKSRFRHYVNLSRVEPRLHQLLATFQFGSMSNALAGYLRSNAIPSHQTVA